MTHRNVKSVAATLVLTAAHPLSGASLAGSRGECLQWDPAIGQPGMSGAVNAVAVLPNGHVVAGGSFTEAGGDEASRIARWDGSNWHPLGAGVNSHVLALAVLPDGDLVAGGTFTEAGGVAANRIARWDGTAWHAMGEGLDGPVWDIAILPDEDVIAAGAFTAAGQVGANRIARWDGFTWHALGGGFDNTVRSVAPASGGALYAGGAFTTADGAVAKYIARWDGAAWSAVGGGIDGAVDHLQVFDTGQGERVLAAGSFTIVDDMFPARHMAQWDGQGWRDYSFGLNGAVQAISVFDDGGGPALVAAVQGEIAGSPATELVRWDGLWWRPVSDPIDGLVRALAAGTDGADAVLYFGGTFQMTGDTPSSRIAQWRPCPAPDPTVHAVPGQYATIQAAIDASVDGDHVLVAPGVYHEAIDFSGKTIVIQSTHGAEVTTIDGTGLPSAVVTIADGERVGTELRGFTITGGTDASGASEGGIFIREATATIDACIITGNGSLDHLGGGGIEIYLDSRVLVRNSTILGNEARFGGGVVVSHNHSARLIDCLIEDNVAWMGGGVNFNNYAIAVVTRCTLRGNSAADWPPVENGNSGGGAWLNSTAFVIIDDCDFLTNSAARHAGGVFSQGTALFQNTRFIGNVAERGGGGWLTGWFNDFPTNLVSQCTFRENDAVSNIGHALGVSIDSGPPTVEVRQTHFCGYHPSGTFPIHGPYEDLGGNTFQAECDPLPGPLGDLNGDGVVDVSDLLILLAAWGGCPRGEDCPADLTEDGAVDVSDLLILLANWG